MIKFFEDLLDEFSVLEWSIYIETAKQLGETCSLEPVSNGEDSATVEKLETIEKTTRENHRLREQVETAELQVTVVAEQTQGIEVLSEKGNGEVERLQEERTHINDEINRLQLEKEKREIIANRFLKPYREGLGLQLNKVTDNIWEVILNPTESSSGSEQITVRLKLNEDRGFEVVLLEPEHSEAERLLEDLRTTNNLRKFISDLRSHRIN